MSGSFGILVDVERNITQSEFSPYHYSPTFIPIAVQTNCALPIQYQQTQLHLVE